MAMAAQAEEDDPRRPFLARDQRFIDGGADGVRRFGRRQNALGARELDRRLEHRELRVGLGLDVAQVAPGG